MGSMVDLPVTAHNADVLDQLLEAARRAERVDTLLAAARYLHFLGHHEQAEILRTDPLVLRFMRKEPRV